MNFQIKLLYTVIIAVFCGLVYWWAPWENFMPKPQIPGGINELDILWQADDEIADAKEKIIEHPEEAMVIVTDRSGLPRVALVIEGLPDRVLTAELVDCLNKHNAKATFFAEGMNAAEESETIKLLKEGNFPIGNYTFVGATRLDKQPVAKVIAELCRAQKVLKAQSGSTPLLFMADRTVYTPEILKAVRACGLDAAVRANVYVDISQIKDQNDADKFALSVPHGSILSMKIGLTVEPPAKAPVPREQTRAVDKKPTVNDPQPTGGKADYGPSFAERFDLLLTAFDRKGVLFEDVSTFSRIKYIPAAMVPVVEGTKPGAQANGAPAAGQSAPQPPAMPAPAAANGF